MQRERGEEELRSGNKRPSICELLGVQAPKKRKPKPCLLEKVISGGQTGADRAGLEAARNLNLDTGGWAPANYLTSQGPDHRLKDFGLQKMPKLARACTMYIQRSKRNVDESDGTVVFRFKRTAGTDKTIGYCTTGAWSLPSAHPTPSPYKPFLVVRNFDEQSTQSLVRFLVDYSIRTLNVAGHRDNTPERVWQKKVQKFLEDALARTLRTDLP